jgi:DNA polymerase III subunit chi
MPLWRKTTKHEALILADVLFYHLTESRLEDALPPLVEKSLARGWRAVIQFAGDESRDLIDTHLWTWRETSFLPHAVAGTDDDSRQPILLTTDGSNGNGANIRFLTGGAEPPVIDAYERVVVMFDGHDNAQLERARAQWKAFSAGSHALTYWQQNGSGGWERKA